MTRKHLIELAHEIWATAQLPPGQPIEWAVDRIALILHDCAAPLTNDVELWIDTCPHCGKPRNAPQPVVREPLAVGRIRNIVDTHIGGPTPSYPLDETDWINFARAIEAAHGIIRNKEHP